MSKIWHIGMAVPDLGQGLKELGDLFELVWRPVVTRSMTITDGAGNTYDIDCDVTFSMGGPFAVEVWQAIPDTPLAMPEAGYFHHIGYWVDNFASESDRLDGLGFSPFFSAPPSLLLSKGFGGLCVEPTDLHRDLPYLRDLYPADSEFAGEPILPAAS
jgi:hypothetical protein